jgi:pimeloyl-ACP methyl ester carboxylesterase
MDHFAMDHRVVAFDPRGQGRSEKVNYGYHVERRARYRRPARASG